MTNRRREISHNLTKEQTLYLLRMRDRLIIGNIKGAKEWFSKIEKREIDNEIVLYYIERMELAFHLSIEKELIKEVYHWCYLIAVPNQDKMEGVWDTMETYCGYNRKNESELLKKEMKK